MKEVPRFVVRQRKVSLPDAGNTSGSGPGPVETCTIAEILSARFPSVLRAPLSTQKSGNHYTSATFKCIRGALL